MTKVNLRTALRQLARETVLTSWELIKITVPVMIAVRLLEEMGAIATLSMVLEPVMNLIGLPGALGLVWATAMLTTLYGGMAVFAALGPGLELTAAQVTVLCCAMLIAHSLPIELGISKRAGAPLVPIALLRFCGAVVYCFMLDRFCGYFGIWQQPAEMLFAAPASHSGTLDWAVQQVQNLCLIILIIFAILLVMRLLRLLRILDFIEWLLAPVLPYFGMGRQAAPITVVGMIMGIGYGGALIIRETSQGKLQREEVVNAMALMGLCHGLVEDTLLMVALGGRIGGIFWGRIVFSLFVTFILVRILSILAGRVKWASRRYNGN